MEKHTKKENVITCMSRINQCVQVKCCHLVADSVREKHHILLLFVNIQIRIYDIEDKLTTTFNSYCRSLHHGNQISRMLETQNTSLRNLLWSQCAWLPPMLTWIRLTKKMNNHISGPFPITVRAAGVVWAVILVLRVPWAISCNKHSVRKCL